MSGWFIPAYPLMEGLKFSHTKWLLAVVHFGLLYAFFNNIPLSEDEAYYWGWSQQLSWSYMDHPPLAAWILAAVSKLFGDATITIRSLGALCFIATYLVLADLIKQAGGSAKQQLLWIVSVIITPYTWAIASSWTPDNALLLFTALFLRSFYLAEYKSNPRHWLYAGCFLGLALLAKYTAIMWGGGLAIFMLLSGRGRLRQWQPWSITLITLLMFLPVIWWNYQHDWISFSFQFDHGLGDSDRGFNWEYFRDFIASQALPIAPAILLLALLSHRIEQKSLLRCCLWCALPALAFLLIASTTNRIHANWCLFSLLLVQLMVALIPWRTWWHGSYLAYLALISCLLIAAIHGVLPNKFLPFQKLNYLADRLYGWEMASEQLADYQKQFPAYTLLGNSYQEQAQIAYRFPASRHLPALSMEVRQSHYNYWGRSALFGKDFLLLIKGYSHADDYLARYFCSFAFVGEVVAKRQGRLLFKHRLYKVNNYLGDVPPPDKTKQCVDISS